MAFGDNITSIHGEDRYEYIFKSGGHLIIDGVKHYYAPHKEKVVWDTKKDVQISGPRPYLISYDKVVDGKKIAYNRF